MRGGLELNLRKLPPFWSKDVMDMLSVRDALVLEIYVSVGIGLLSLHTNANRRRIKSATKTRGAGTRASFRAGYAKLSLSRSLSTSRFQSGSTRSSLHHDVISQAFLDHAPLKLVRGDGTVTYSLGFSGIKLECLWYTKSYD